MDAEEDDQQAKPDARIEPSREDVVVPHPPSEVVPAHKEVKEEADDCPHCVVDARGWRDGSSAAEEDRHVDIAPEGEGEAPGEEVQWDGSDGANQEEPKHGGVPGRYVSE